VSILEQAFYERDALDVARDLLGKRLVRRGVEVVITEVEAYRFPGDTANHCRMGRTPRNAVMWGPPGHAYVYVCYGIHQMLNLVTNPEGEGAAVLIRACQPVRGLRTIQRRRGDKRGPVLLTGPGKVGAALGLDRAMNGHALYRPGGLEVHDGPAPPEILSGPRVGIDYASEAHRDAPWRLAASGTPWVSKPASLHRVGP